MKKIDKKVKSGIEIGILWGGVFGFLVASSLWLFSK